MNTRCALRAAATSFLLLVPSILSSPPPATAPAEQLVAMVQISGEGAGEIDLGDVLGLEEEAPTARSAGPAASLTTVARGRRAAAAAPTALAANGVPSAALRAYRTAETTMSIADPSCHLSWGLLAGVGQVESDHGRSGGAVVGAGGRSTPLIVGVPLNGAGLVAAIADTDAGRIDGDRRWDRAVGPMQFIPSTWAIVGVDGDGDGERSPHDLDDAALAAAAYLCAGRGDLSTAHGMQEAVFSYNHSDEYVTLVLRVANTYRSGLVDLPALAARPLPGGGPSVAVGVGRPGRGVQVGASDDVSENAKGDRGTAKDARKTGPEGTADRRGHGKPKRGGAEPTRRPDRRDDDRAGGDGPKEPDQRSRDGHGSTPGGKAPKRGTKTPPAPERKPKPRPRSPEAPEPQAEKFTGTVSRCGVELCLGDYTLSGPEPYEEFIGQVVTVLAARDGETLLVVEVVEAAPPLGSAAPTA